ncbi:hypothetical protein CQW23_23443 [Capsicum baccatum]|uniref:Uncharacterized protein n=1 Tax=Capsicum baccatum TaxID=33114 RepID=A0A2G2VS16_CAPBA|nr:hypothetical protein CQW23_23443 [Capsicum baccatum]
MASLIEQCQVAPPPGGVPELTLPLTYFDSRLGYVPRGKVWKVEVEHSEDQENEEADRESEQDGPKKRGWYSLVDFSGDDPYYDIVVKKTHTTYYPNKIRQKEEGNN